jgi:hypothetical protein
MLFRNIPLFSLAHLSKSHCVSLVGVRRYFTVILCYKSVIIVVLSTDTTATIRWHLYKLTNLLNFEPNSLTDSKYLGYLSTTYFQTRGPNMLKSVSLYVKLLILISLQCRFLKWFPYDGQWLYSFPNKSP